MHLSRLPSGTWRVAAKVNGRRRTATAPTEALARLRGAELEVELGAKPRDKPDKITVGDLLDAHLADVDWSPTTRLDAERVAKALPAVFRARIVSDVDAATIAALFRELTRVGWSPHRIQRVRMVLSTAWVTATSYRWATYNPVRDARSPKLPHRDINPPDAAQVDAILAAAGDGPFGLFVCLAAATGARRGELVALQWRDLDLDRRRWRITRSLVWTVEGREERDTKTSVKGHRTLTLGAGIASRLERHRDEQLARAAAAGVEPVWVFSHDAGATPWRPDYTSREFTHVCARAGVSGVRLHDVRHHVATSLLDEGVAVTKVSKRLGHASTATTQRIYSHWIIDDDDIGERLDRE